MVKAYLTIDDSPSSDFLGKVNFLSSISVPAIFFCRGDLIEGRRDELIEAIQRGFIIGSHSYIHKRHSLLSLEECLDSIRRNDEILEELYLGAGVKRRKKVFRFPYLDNGCGSFPSSKEGLSVEEIRWLEKVMKDVVGESKFPDIEQISKKEVLQNELKVLGYKGIPGVNISAYNKGFGSFDSNITYCSNDWHLILRHQKTYQETVKDLKRKIEEEILSLKDLSVQIMLFHDYGEKIVDEAFRFLISFMKEEGVDFLDLNRIS